jgi:hypothetical protein
VCSLSVSGTVSVFRGHYMSAGAAARAVGPAAPRRSRSIPVPPEMRSQVELTKPFVAFTRAFLSACRRKCPGGRIEVLILLWLSEQCYGGYKKPDGDGEYERPEWVLASAESLADEMIASEDGILLALRSIEKANLIESRMVGRDKWIRLCPEKFESAPDRVPRQVTKRPEKEQCSNAVIPMAAQKEVALTHGISARCHNDCSIPICMETSSRDDGSVDIHLSDGPDDAEVTTIKSAGCADRGTQLRRFAADDSGERNGSARH